MKNRYNTWTKKVRVQVGGLKLFSNKRTNWLRGKDWP